MEARFELFLCTAPIVLYRNITRNSECTIIQIGDIIARMPLFGERAAYLFSGIIYIDMKNLPTTRDDVFKLL